MHILHFLNLLKLQGEHVRCVDIFLEADAEESNVFNLLEAVADPSLRIKSSSSHRGADNKLSSISSWFCFSLSLVFLLFFLVLVLFFLVFFVGAFRFFLFEMLESADDDDDDDDMIVDV